MTIATYCLIGWLIFVAIVYFHVWYDITEQNFDIVAKLTKIKETFTEDE